MVKFNILELVGAKQTIQFGWKAFNWARAWNNYEKRILENYGNLFVLGKANSVPIEDIYTSVNVRKIIC